MEENSSQFDLFSDQKGQMQFKSHKQPPSIIKKFERGILLAISAIIISIVSFSFGVVKGRNAASFEMPQVEELPDLKKPVAAKEEITIKQPSAAVTPVVTSGSVKSEINKYTIQVASFNTEKYAKMEAEALKKKGFPAETILFKNRTAVCVGRFPDKAAASILLSKLKTKYSDCFVRRLE